jgi:phosphatidylserine decarboxylase
MNYIFYAPEILFIFSIIVLFGLYFKSIIIFIVSLIFIILMLFFYRSASDKCINKAKKSQENDIICPCDGKVLAVSSTDKHVHIAIFLNVHNVHVQYVPVNGIIKSIYHKSGEFHPAYLFEKSKLNERVETTIDTKWGEIIVVQIAGLIARRIVSFHTEGNHIEKGDPLGLIKFGSRVDIWLPKESVNNILIKEGQIVNIGDTLVQMIN